MLRRLAQRLLLSAAGRNLAIDLVEKHGERALEVVDAAIASGRSHTADQRILGLARGEILKLLPLLQPRGAQWAGWRTQAPVRRTR